MRASVTINESGVSVRLDPDGDFDHALLKMLDHEWNAQVYVEKDYRNGFGNTAKPLAAVFSLTHKKLDPVEPQ